MPSLPPVHRHAGWRPQQQAQRERRALADLHRPSSTDRGYSAKWRRESKAFLALPGNELCACGCGRSATMVDHRVAHKGDMKLFWDRSNWQPMFGRCNSRKAVREEGALGKAMPGYGKSVGGALATDAQV
jgi:5-methylcytosine-specific restriction enzyme A